MPEDKIAALHAAASEKFDVGTVDEFKQKLQDPAKRKAFYDAASSEFDLGDYSSFEGKVALKKKEPTASTLPSKLPVPADYGGFQSAAVDGTSNSTPGDAASLKKNLGPIVELSKTSSQNNPPVSGDPIVGTDANGNPQITPSNIAKTITSPEAVVAPVAANTNQEAIGKDQAFYDPELQKRGLKMGDDTEALMRGSMGLLSSVLKAPAFIYDIGTYQARKDSGGLIPSSSEIGDMTGIHNTVANDLDSVVEESRKRYAEKYDKSISEYIDAGDYDKATDVLALSVIESLPTTLSLMAGNVAGLGGVASTALGGAVFGAGKNSELEKNNPEMDEGARLANSLGTGLLEGVTENAMGLTKLGAIAKNVFMKEGAEAAKKVAVEGYKKVYGTMLKKYLGVQGGEVAGEVANQFGENVLDKYMGVDPERKLNHGLWDAGIVGFASSAGMTGAVAAIDVVKTKKAVKQAADIAAQKQTLTNDLASPDVTPEAKKIISDKIQNLNVEEADLAQSEKEKFNGLTEEHKKKVDSLLDETHKLTAVTSDPNVSDETREIIKKEIDVKDKEIDKAFEEGAEAKKKEIEQETERSHELKYLQSLKEEGFGLNPEEQSRFDELNKNNVGHQDQAPAAKQALPTNKIDGEISQPIELNPTIENPENVKNILKTEDAAKINPEVKSEEKATDVKKAEPVKSDKKEVELPPAVEWSKLPRKMTFDEKSGSWMENVGGELSRVSPVQQKQAQEAFDAKQTNTGSQTTEENVVENKSPAQESQETTVADPVETPVVSQKIQEEENTDIPDPVKNKEKIPTDIIDEEEQKIASEDSKKVSDPAVLSKMDDDMAAIKQITDPAILEKKFTGMVARAWKNKDEGKITRSEYVAFRNKAKDIAGGKLVSKLGEAEAKAQVSSFINKVKLRLLGEGYKNMALSSMSPVTPKTVADLLNLTEKLIHRGIEAGFSIAQATTKALNVVRNHPTYKKLSASKELNEDEFDNTVKASVKETIAKKEADDKKDADTKSSSEKIDPKDTKPEDGDIYGEVREKRPVTRMRENKKYQKVLDQIKKEDQFYTSINQKKADEYIKEVLNKFEKAEALEVLAQDIISNNSPFHEKIALRAARHLADRLLVLSEKESNDFLKTQLEKTAAALKVMRIQNLNVAATQVGLENDINKTMPLSVQGLKEFARETISNTQDINMTKEQKESVPEFTKEALDALVQEKVDEKLSKAIESELVRISEETNGKDWTDNVVDTLDSLKIDLTGC